MTDSSDNELVSKKIRVTLSKIRFPENCPVCMKPAEDLVFITIIESYGPESYESSSWAKQDDKLSRALQSARSATTFSVPTCMTHGSKSVRDNRTRFVAVIGFFVLFYPIIFFLLQVNLALVYSRPLVEPVLGAAFFCTLLLFTLLYGLFPRALERKLKFENTSRIKDSVDVIIENPEYRELFLEMNAIFAEPISDE